MSESATNTITWIVIWCVIIGLICGFIGLLGQIIPRYNVWNQEMSGRAKLAEAISSRKIVIEEAKAKEEAAKSLAAAEIERARGVAKANQIIGESLKGNADYLRWLWIDKLEAGENREVIYVPTEAGLPLLEAGRIGTRVGQKAGH